MKLLEFTKIEGDVVHVIQLKKGANTKLGLHVLMIQTYHYGMEQIQHNDITRDKVNCLDCRFSFNRNNGESGGCYTHKGNQFRGIKAMLKYLHKRYKIGTLGKVDRRFDTANLQEFTERAKAYEDKNDTKISLVRFGAYGEPVLMSLEFLETLSKVTDRKKWTGYTHQWRDLTKWEYSRYLQASCHTVEEMEQANLNLWRAFVAADELIKGAVNCPASKEAGYRTTCAKCALCNGTQGNSKKNIVILKH